MRLCLLFLLLSLMCAPEKSEPINNNSSLNVEQIGEITDRRISEISGMAASTHENALWVVNDSGDDANVYAISKSGEILTTVKLEQAVNYDWEDVASFELDGQTFLLIADIGGNTAFRDIFTLYVLKEPSIQDNRASIAWKLHFKYEDGARDAEAVFVDVKSGKILLLSKRDVPAVLYELPLRPTSSQALIALRVGEIGSIPQPLADEINHRLDRYHAQPTSMDISPDHSKLAVLTYRRMFVYEHEQNESWLQTLNKPPVIFEFPKLEQAEAICFDHKNILITTENVPAPILQVELD